ncbi:8912_t:CDS:2 [Ambispora gerdemannii]|uniref:8912_t:CDS:1 n=1 Tax=Ambispora gerdemannii TaxID=144530 RepID=A0A9N9FNQ4_9GLOM|nr:8912_t:CDS:2 [Ambispora gerdemannii]
MIGDYRVNSAENAKLIARAKFIFLYNVRTTHKRTAQICSKRNRRDKKRNRGDKKKENNISDNILVSLYNILLELHKKETELHKKNNLLQQRSQEVGSSEIVKDLAQIKDALHASTIHVPFPTTTTNTQVFQENLGRTQLMDASAFQQNSDYNTNLWKAVKSCGWEWAVDVNSAEDRLHDNFGKLLGTILDTLMGKFWESCKVNKILYNDKMNAKHRFAPGPDPLCDDVRRFPDFVLDRLKKYDYAIFNWQTMTLPIEIEKNIIVNRNNTTDFHLDNLNTHAKSGLGQQQEWAVIRFRYQDVMEYESFVTDSVNIIFIKAVRSRSYELHTFTVSPPFALVENSQPTDAFKNMVRIIGDSLLLLKAKSMKAAEKSDDEFNPSGHWTGRYVIIDEKDFFVREVICFNVPDFVYAAWSNESGNVVIKTAQSKYRFDEHKNEQKILQELSKRTLSVPKVIAAGYIGDAFALVLTPLGKSFNHVRPISKEKAKKVWKDCISDLKQLHETGIVHGDIRPTNIILYEGNYRLIDFGLAGSREQRRWRGADNVYGSIRALEGHNYEAWDDVESLVYTVESLKRPRWQLPWYRDTDLERIVKLKAAFLNSVASSYELNSWIEWQDNDIKE